MVSVFSKPQTASITQCLCSLSQDLIPDNLISCLLHLCNEMSKWGTEGCYFSLTPYRDVNGFNKVKGSEDSNAKSGKIRQEHKPLYSCRKKIIEEKQTIDKCTEIALGREGKEGKEEDCNLKITMSKAPYESESQMKASSEWNNTVPPSQHVIALLLG